MKNIITISTIVVAGACPGIAQYTDETTPLSVVASTSKSESYVNRITDETAASSVKLAGYATYSANNVNITNNYDGSNMTTGCGIQATNSADSINITADEGTWNIITMNGAWGVGIRISTLQSSSVANTKIYNTSNNGNGIRVNGSSLTLDNIEIHQSISSGSGVAGAAIYISDGGSVSNKDKGGITITTDSSVVTPAVIWAETNATLDFYDTTINVYQTQSGTGGILHACQGSSVSLTNSNIASSDGNTLVYTHQSGTGTVNLNNVNLDNAKNQQILASESTSILNVNLSGGTNFDGYASLGVAGANINIALGSGASWNVTENSVLGQAGSLSLDASSTISFVTVSGDFTNINAASIMLEAGSILQLDQDASAFSEGEMLTLFTGAAGDSFTNNGAVLVTADGYTIDYLDHDNGSFEVVGIAAPVIPESMTGTLGLFALGMLAVQRRKVA